MFITKRNNGIYYIVYECQKGRRCYKSTNTKLKSVAQKYLNLFQRQYLDKKLLKIIPITFYEFKTEFLKYSLAVHSDKSIKAFKTTFKFFEKYFGDINLDAITVEKAEKYLLHRISTSSKFAARKDHINLSSAFSKALKNGHISENPFKKIKRIKLPEKLPLFFTKEEYEKLLSAISNKDLSDIIVFTINTGLRQSEITNLKWKQIDFSRKLFILDNQSFVTKSKRIRTIPLNVHTMDILNSRNKDCEYVFTFNGRSIQPDWLSKYFKQYVRLSKINPKLTFHSLRHTFASWLVQKGVSLYIVSKLLGHANIKTTMIYSHLRTEDLRNATDLL